jgi:hypothetical protein
MRRPRMSTGAWIFAGLVCAAVIAPITVYAASVSKVAIGSTTNANVASVTAQQQLLTTVIGPSRVVRADTVAHSGCTTVYTPPAGKAIVVTSVVYNYGSGTAGGENFGGLFSAGCDVIYDQIDQTEKFGSIQHTFPTGLPMNGVAATNDGGPITVFIVGYLIDASALPPNSASQVSRNVKAFSPTR